MRMTWRFASLYASCCAVGRIPPTRHPEVDVDRERVLRPARPLGGSFRIFMSFYRRDVFSPFLVLVNRFWSWRAIRFSPSVKFPPLPARSLLQDFGRRSIKLSSAAR